MGNIKKILVYVILLSLATGWFMGGMLVMWIFGISQHQPIIATFLGSVHMWGMIVFSFIMILLCGFMIMLEVRNQITLALWAGGSENSNTLDQIQAVKES